MSLRENAYNQIIELLLMQRMETVNMNRGKADTDRFIPGVLTAAYGLRSIFDDLAQHIVAEK